MRTWLFYCGKMCAVSEDTWPEYFWVTIFEYIQYHASLKKRFLRRRIAFAIQNWRFRAGHRHRPRIWMGAGWLVENLKSQGDHPRTSYGCTGNWNSYHINPLNHCSITVTIIHLKYVIYMISIFSWHIYILWGFTSVKMVSGWDRWRSGLQHSIGFTWMWWRPATAWKDLKIFFIPTLKTGPGPFNVDAKNLKVGKKGKHWSYEISKGKAPYRATWKTHGALPSWQPGSRGSIPISHPERPPGLPHSAENLWQTDTPKKNTTIMQDHERSQKKPVSITVLQAFLVSEIVPLLSSWFLCFPLSSPTTRFTRSW